MRKTCLNCKHGQLFFLFVRCLHDPLSKTKKFKIEWEIPQVKEYKREGYKRREGFELTGNLIVGEDQLGNIIWDNKPCEYHEKVMT